MSDEVRPLVGRLPAGHVQSLEHLTDELAAAALTDLFLRTGSAQARVKDPEAVRRLIRRDCRQRGCRVRTIAAHGVVVAYEDERYEAFLATDAGEAYRREMEDRMLSAFSELPPSPPSPALRLVPPPDPVP